jgi:hypothetical protein
LAILHLVVAAALGSVYARRATAGTTGAALGWFGMGAVLGGLTHVFGFVPDAASVDHGSIVHRILANTVLLSAPAWLVFAHVWRRLGRTDVKRAFQS